MDRSPPLSNAMVALFGQELARKVADSVPMQRAAALLQTVKPERIPGHFDLHPLIDRVHELVCRHGIGHEGRYSVLVQRRHLWLQGQP